MTSEAGRPCIGSLENPQDVVEGGDAVSSRTVICCALSRTSLILGLLAIASCASHSDQVEQLLDTNACPTCDLSGTNLQRLDLQQADLRGANLQEANLQQANLRDVLLIGSNLQQANLMRVNLDDAILVNANLQSASLQRARIRGADLRGAQFKGADLESADLSHSSVDPVALEAARLCATVMPDQTIEKRDCS